MSYSSGLITKGTAGITIKADGTGDIQQALGTSEKDLGALCTHASIKMFSRKKPCITQGYDTPDDATYAANYYYVKAIATSVRGDLYSMALGWTYEGAQAPYYRQLDFDGYYNAPKTPLMQANGQSLTVDLVAGNAPPALFYMLMRSGALANKAFSTASGIATSGTAVPSNRLAYCMSVEDLGFYDGGSYHTLIGARLGLVIFDANGDYAGEVWAGRDVEVLNTRYNEMFNVPTNGLTLTPGTYTAVACARKSDLSLGYVYMPVFNDASYPARFTFIVGGFDNYKQMRWGVSLSEAVSNAQSVTTKLDDVYVTMRFYNDSDNAITIATGSNAKFQLVTEFVGTIVRNGVTQTIDRTVANGKAYRTSMILNSGTTVSIAAGSYGELLYKVENIWSLDGTSGGQQLDSGSVSIKSSIYYNGGTEFDINTGHRVLTANYGN